jgi:hypothetical protein
LAVPVTWREKVPRGIAMTVLVPATGLKLKLLFGALQVAEVSVAVTCRFVTGPAPLVAVMETP